MKYTSKFNALNWQWQVIIVISVAFILSILVGPLSQFYADKKLLEREALERGVVLAELLAATNVDAFSSGREIEFITDTVSNERGVRNARITKEIPENDKPKVVYKKFGHYEIIAPIKKGSNVIGSAMVDFEVRSNLYFLGTLVLMTAFMSAGIFASIGLIHQRLFTSNSAHENKKELLQTAEDKTLANYIKSPLIFFDEKFKVYFANPSVLQEYPEIIGKHITDIKKEYVAMAEELEMFQLDEVKSGLAVIWRFKKGEKGYGLTY